VEKNQMLPRVGRILLIVWQAFCLNVFLPAHTRGAMTVPGVRCNGTAEGRACCSHKATPKDKPTPEQRSRCAVCYFAMGLSPCAVLDCGLRPLGLLEILPVAVPTGSPSNDFPLTYYACGPPALG
jgi:hypothetical protein